MAGKTSCLNGDWTIVLPRRGRKSCSTMRIQERQPPQEESVNWAPTDFEVNSVRESRLKQKMEMCMKKLETCKFFLTLLSQIESPEMMHCFHKVLGSELKMKMKMEMVIYGIGSIESYENPRLQLGLALLLKRKLSWIGGIEVFDPVLSATESRVIEFLGCSVLSVNEQGRRKVQKPTMFFMPHCEAELYDNLLQENWRVGQLNNIVLFGNSFDNYQRLVFEFNNSIVSSARHMLSVRKFTDEFKIQTVSDDYFAAFHDSSWHFFTPVIDLGLEILN